MFWLIKEVVLDTLDLSTRVPRYKYNGYKFYSQYLLSISFQMNGYRTGW